MKYRDHRGSLSASMQTVVETIKEELEAHLVKELGPGKIKIEKYGFDPRIGWDTYIVTHNGRAVGFTDGPG